MHALLKAKMFRELNKTRQRFMLAIVGAWIFALQPFSCPAMTVQVESGRFDEVANREVQQLIIELGDASFSTRQRAMERLWAMGDDAKDILRTFTADTDAEIAVRAKRILEHLEFGIRPDMAPSIAAAIYSFHKSDVNQQYLILDGLVGDGQLELTLNLIDSIQDPPHRYSLMMQAFPEGESLSQGFLASNAHNDMEQLDHLMNHRLMWEFHAGDCATYFAIRGNTSEQIARLRDSLNGDDANDSVRQQLIAHYRMIGESESAVAVARELNENASLFELALLIEAGDWNSASEKKPERWGQDLQASAENVLLCSWSDDQQLFENRLQKLYEDFQPDDHANRLANLHLLTMDSNWLLQNIMKFDRAFAFQFLCHLHRFEEAFELAGIPDGHEQRKLWYQSEVDKLQDYIQRIIRQLDVDDRAARNQFEFCLEFASVVGSLGNMDEALEYFDILIEGIKWKDEEFFQAWNESVFEQLCRLDPGPRIWTYLLALGMDRAGRQVYSYVFPNSRLQAIFWQSVLQDEIRDPVDRMRFIATLVRSPFAGDAEVDIRRLASIGRESLEKMPIRMRRNQLLALAETLKIHGLKNSAQDLKVESGYLGHIAAFETLAHDAAQTGDWPKAASWYRQAIQVGTDPHLMNFSYQLAMKQGGRDGYAKDQFDESLLSILNSNDWIKVTDRAAELSADEMSTELLGVFLRSENLFEADSDFYRRHLAGQLKHQDPIASTRLYRQASHSYFRLLFGAEFPNLAFHQLSTEIHFGEVRVLIAAGRYDEAMELMRRLASFVSGNSELAEEFVPVLEEADRHEDADELFGLIADRYLKVLDSYPNSATHHNNYAWVSARCQRDLDRALVHAEKAVELSPRHTSYMDTLAEVCFRRGDTGRALDLAKQCVVLNPYKQHYREQVERFQQASQSDRP